KRPETRTRGVPRGITCLVPSRWLRECRPLGLRPLLGLNLRGKNLLRSHPPRIQRRSCLVLQECVLLRRRTLPSSAPETQPHLPSGATLRNIWLERADHSALMPANFTTLPHFSVSSAMSLPKSVDESASGVLPRSAIRALILGSARPALISRLSLSIISAGVFLGAPRPIQPLASYPGKNSATEGTSGSASTRVAFPTPSARSLPALMCPIDEASASKANCT